MNPAVHHSHTPEKHVRPKLARNTHRTIISDGSALRTQSNNQIKQETCKARTVITNRNCINRNCMRTIAVSIENNDATAHVPIARVPLCADPKFRGTTPGRRSWCCLTIHGRRYLLCEIHPKCKHCLLAELLFLRQGIGRFEWSSGYRIQC